VCLYNRVGLFDSWALFVTPPQLIVIHRTIETYNQRNEAYQASFINAPNGVGTLGTIGRGNKNRSLSLSSLLKREDLVFLKNFLPVWIGVGAENRSLDWRTHQTYPYRLTSPQDHQGTKDSHNYNQINHLDQSRKTKPICSPVSPFLRKILSFYSLFNSPSLIKQRSWQSESVGGKSRRFFLFLSLKCILLRALESWYEDSSFLIHFTA
jgi:hypothetical protein